MAVRRLACLAPILWACSAAPPPARPTPSRRPPPLRPLATAEMQEIVDGAARLNRSCRQLQSDTALYQVRLTIDPDGSVTQVEPMRAPARSSDPSAFSQVPRYIDGERDPHTPVILCFAKAFGELRFRRFPGAPVAFDYPIVVENLPPAEPESDERRCEQDEDCVWRPSPPCSCQACGQVWRRAVNRDTAAQWRRRWRKERRRRCRQRRRRPCAPCNEPSQRRGRQALCLDQQCTVR